MEFKPSIFSLSLSPSSQLSCALQKRKEEKTKMGNRHVFSHRLTSFLSFSSLGHSLSLSWLTTTTHFPRPPLSSSSRKPVIYIIECIHFYTKKNCGGELIAEIFCSICESARIILVEKANKIQEHLKMPAYCDRFFFFSTEFIQLFYTLERTHRCVVCPVHLRIAPCPWKTDAIESTQRRSNKANHLAIWRDQFRAQGRWWILSS